MPDASATAPSLTRLLKPVLDTPLARELEKIRESTGAMDSEVFLVGGLVRDLLVGRHSKDIDLLTLGEPEPLARVLADRLGGVPRLHEEFRTATLETDAGFRVDLAAARAEEYPSPGALPQTRPGTLTEDLGRRDFTVNAMAASLIHPEAPVVDLHDGLGDLEARRLRVLHPDSFRDDPTRVLRAARFLVELGFELEPGSLRLAASSAARDALTGVSGFRIWRELAMALRSGPAARAVVALLSELGLEPAIDPDLAAVPETLRELSAAPAVSPVEYLTIWAGALDRDQRARLADRLALDRAGRRLLLTGRG